MMAPMMVVNGTMVMMRPDVMMVAPHVMMMTPGVVMMLHLLHRTTFGSYRNRRQWRCINTHEANTETKYCSEK